MLNSHLGMSEKLKLKLPAIEHQTPIKDQEKIEDIV